MAALPRPVGKYLASLPSQLQETLTPLVARVAEALQQEAPTGEIVEILAGTPDLAAELVLVEALSRLAHPRLPEILQIRLREARDKPRQKALKKALHHLKTQGFDLPSGLLPVREDSLFRPLPVSRAIKGYMSRIEGNGSRMVILQFPSQEHPFTLFLALANDVEGLTDAYAVRLSNKEAKKYLDETRESMPGELVELPPDYAWQMIEDAYQANPEPDSEANQTYRQARPYLQDRLQRELVTDILSLLPPLEEPGPYLEQSRDLPVQDDFLTWLFTPEALGPWLEKIQAIEQSPLVLSPEQQHARMEQTIDQAIQDLFTPDQQLRLSRRLLEMAYYLDHSHRPLLARQAQAAGLDLLRERSPLERPNPFLFGLLMFPLRELYDHEKEAQTPPPAPPGRIITDI